eukprot:3938596-Rhodomonas_salina.6
MVAFCPVDVVPGGHAVQIVSLLVYEFASTLFHRQLDASKSNPFGIGKGSCSFRKARNQCKMQKTNRHKNMVYICLTTMHSANNLTSIRQRGNVNLRKHIDRTTFALALYHMDSSRAALPPY